MSGPTPSTRPARSYEAATDILSERDPVLRRLVAQAAGNPMALIELATVIADDPAASRRWAAEPLPLTGPLTAVLTSRFAALPEPVQGALLLAAVADSPT